MWKRAAKNFRQMFILCARISVPLWQQRFWAAKRWAQAWKAVAKKHRRQHKQYKEISERQKVFIRGLVEEIEGLEARLEERGKEDGEI